MGQVQKLFIYYSSFFFLLFSHFKDLFLSSDSDYPEVFSFSHVLVVIRNNLPHMVQAHTIISIFLTKLRFHVKVMDFFLLKIRVFQT